MPKIKVSYDECSQSFLVDELHEDDFGTFVAWHRRRNLGEVNYPKHQEFLEGLEEGAMKIPIFIYEHSGFVLSTTPFACQWDSGQVGVWVFTSEDLVRIYGADSEETRARAREGVDAQIGYMNAVYNGDVWRYDIEDFDGEIADSCGGFVGEDALECMKGHVPENLHADLEQAWENRLQ